MLAVTVPKLELGNELKETYLFIVILVSVYKPFLSYALTVASTEITLAAPEVKVKLISGVVLSIVPVVIEKLPSVPFVQSNTEAFAIVQLVVSSTATNSSL